MLKIEIYPIISRRGERTRIPWPAYQSDTPGLAVHKRIVPDYGNDHLMPKAGSAWTVTHTRSGYNVDGCKDFARRKDALAMAEWLGGLLDWTQDKDWIVRHRKGLAEEIVAKAKEIME